VSCSHGFEKASQCVDCMLDGPVDNAWRKIGDTIRAQYPTSCADCGLQIHSGQLLQRWDKGDPSTSTVYTHPEHKPS
jgi:hypothetical protein